MPVPVDFSDDGAGSSLRGRKMNAALYLFNWWAISTRQVRLPIRRQQPSCNEANRLNLCSIFISRLAPGDKVAPVFASCRASKAPKPMITRFTRLTRVWENRAAFQAWTRSEAFRAAHHRAGDNKPLYLGHPQFEGFEVRQTVEHGKAEAA